ncbi:MAG: GxxExxY protein [Chitinophagales bacterium]
MTNEHLKYAEITFGVIGAAIAVHKALGNGFQEMIYQRALEIEMQEEQITFTREHEMHIYYRNQIIGSRRVDFLIKGIISVEIKAITKLEDVHIAQAMNYLEVYNLEVGLLINFGEPSLHFKRFTNKKYKPFLTIP